MKNSLKPSFKAAFAAIILGSLVYATSFPMGKLPTLSLFLDPWNGAYRTARNAHESSRVSDVQIPGLKGAVSIYRDSRNVPHITAENDMDAVAALGYLSAQERLFQMDFQTRVASGRLSEVFGKDRITSDKFLRRTGMLFGAERTWAEIEKNTPEMKALLEAFTRGANAHISSLSERDYPFEFRLLGYKPEEWSPLKCLLINQLMAFDLTFQGQLGDVVMEEMREKLGDTAFAELYPNNMPINFPQSPEKQGVVRKGANEEIKNKQTVAQTLLSAPQDDKHKILSALPIHTHLESRIIATLLNARQSVADIYAEPDEGKGSNNWVVNGSKTQSGKPLLAGDPHLGLSLPAIWYEAHLITPSMNLYGVTIPGAPSIIVGFNDHVAWTPTNTGADVVDFYSVKFSDTKQQQYRYKGEWQSTTERVMPLVVKGAATEQDTVRFTRWGPVMTVDSTTLSVRWTAQEPVRILEAIWGFNHAKNLAEFDEAHRNWDVPAQNIAFADKQGNIGLRSAGYYPLRRCGHGRGVHDGETDAGEWIGRVPFDSVPGSVNPLQGWLQSANQEPTPADYPYYLNYNWGDLWRGARISEYLSSAQNLAPADFEKFQSDVKVMQWAFLKESLAKLNIQNTVSGKNAETKKQAMERLLAWNGVADTSNQSALLLHIFMRLVRREVWDEMLVPSKDNPAIKELRGTPSDPMMFHLLKNEPSSRWLDVASTPERETASDVLRHSLTMALDTLVDKYGTNPDGWAWGKHHKLVIRHLTRSDALQALWRGPYPFIGFQSTVLPAGSLMTTHSASWRMVVDFAGGKPHGYAVFPGGPSGNPFSRWYDSQIPTWLQGKLNDLQKPENEAACKQANMRLAVQLRP
jgi:penicillin amidase